MEKRSRSEQARINGAKSRGPVTPGGKARSARNSTKHGRYARSGDPVVSSVLLLNEDQEAFLDQTDRLFQDFLPVNSFECSLVRELATIDWEIDRISTFRTHTLDHQIGQEAETIRGQNGSLRGVNVLTISTRASAKLIDTSKCLQFYGRELTRLQRARRDVLHTLISYRKHFQTFERSEDSFRSQQLDLRNEPELPDLESASIEPEAAPEAQLRPVAAVSEDQPGQTPHDAPVGGAQQPRPQPPDDGRGCILTLERRPAA